jgi:hypothetical protein
MGLRANNRQVHAEVSKKSIPRVQQSSRTNMVFAQTSNIMIFFFGAHIFQQFGKECLIKLGFTKISTGLIDSLAVSISSDWADREALPRGALKRNQAIKMESRPHRITKWSCYICHMTAHWNNRADVVLVGGLVQFPWTKREEPGHRLGRNCSS